MTRRLRVRNVYPFSDEDRAMLAALSPDLEIVHEGEDDPAWVDALDDPDAEVLSASYPPATTAGTRRLRWLASAGAGIDYLADRDPWSQGITVTNGSGLHAVAMAQYILGAVLFASEHLGGRLANQDAREWTGVQGSLAGRRLRGRTALIVGYGSIGREAARLLDALGLRILAIKADPGSRRDKGWVEPGTGDVEGRLPDRLAGPDALIDLVPEADHVILTLPATERTIGIVSRDVLAAMRPDAWLVNVGRGRLIDEAALAEVLGRHAIGGAVLDVFVDEPLPPESPFWGLEDCLVTPHVSGLGGMEAFWHGTALLLAENLRRELAGEPLLNRTDPVAGY